VIDGESKGGDSDEVICTHINNSKVSMLGGTKSIVVADVTQCCQVG